MGWISFVIAVVLSFYCLWQLRKKTTLKAKYLLMGWGIKLSFSVLFIFIFSYYYGSGQLYGDAFHFMNDSRVIAEFGRSQPGEFFKLMLGLADEGTLFNTSILADTNIWAYGENGDFINDNRLLIRINTFIQFISFGNVYVHGLVLSFLSYVGLILLYQTFSLWIKNKVFFFFVMVAFPSIAFWGSGITKESVLIFALGVFFYGLFRLMSRFSIRALLMLTVGGLMLLFNKPHVGLIILALSPMLYIGQLTNWSRKIRLFFIPAVLIGIIVLTYTPSKINLLDKISYKQRDLINMGKGGIFFINDSSFCAFDFNYLQHFDLQADKKIQVLKNTPGEYKLFGQQTFHPFEIKSSENLYDVYLVQPPSASYVDVTPIDYSRKQLLMTLPNVMLNTVVRPFPWDAGSKLKWASFISNLLFLVLVGCVLFNRKKLVEKEKYLVTYFVSSAVLILLLIGWTTPILGAIVRYKIAAELLLLIPLFISLKQLKNAS